MSIFALQVMETDIRIERAKREDAPYIARGIAVALHLGQEDSAIPVSTTADTEIWHRIFSSLAAMKNSQYSYRNTYKAVDPDGNILGIIISYDGARLHELREAFFNEVRKVTGKEPEPFADETDPSEWYIDSFAVWPEHRGRGIGRMLLYAAKREASAKGKPAGLLVDKANSGARYLYESVGFRHVGDRPFIDVMMDHLQTPVISDDQSHL